MKKIIIVGLFLLFATSCVVPYSSYDYDTPRHTYYPYTYYQPTRTIIVKQKHNHKHRPNKRHVKVKTNKHRKTK